MTATDSHSGSQYVQTDSFHVSEIVSWDVSSERVAILDGENTVHVIGSERTLIEVPETTTDIALGTHLYVLGAERIGAYALTGTRIWRAEIVGAKTVVTTVDAEYAIVLTANDELIGLDMISGEEQFRTERPHADVAAAPEVTSTDQHVVLAAWSFLSVLDANGETVTELRLDGAIVGQGIVGETVVCAMKDGRLFGIDLESGERCWTHDWNVERIDPYATSELPVQVNGELRAVAPDGSYRTLWADEGIPVAAARGDPFCLIANDVVRIYHRVDQSVSDLSAMIDADQLSPDHEQFSVSIENTGTRPVVSEIELTASGLTVLDETRTVTIPGGKTERLQFDVTDIDSESVQLSLSADGGPLLERDLEVQLVSSSLTVEPTVTGITPDGIDIDLEVANHGQTTLEKITIDPLGPAVSPLPPETTKTVSLEGRTEPITVTASLAGTAVDVEERLQPTELITDEPLTGSVTFEQGVLITSVRNRTEVPVTDQFTLESEALPRRFEQRLTIDPRSTVRYLVPPSRSGITEISLESNFVSETSQVTVPDWNQMESPDGMENQINVEQSETKPTLEDSSDQYAEPVRNTVTSDERPPTNRVDTGDESLPVVVDRTIDPDNPKRDHVLTESIRIKNESKRSVEPTVVTDDEEIDTVTVTIDPGEFVRLERQHAGLKTETVTIPALSVAVDGQTTSIDARQIELEMPPVRCRATITNPIASDPKLSVGFQNHTHNRCMVNSIVVGDSELLAEDEIMDVSPQETATCTIAFQSSQPLEEQVVIPVEYTCVRSGAEPRTCRTLALVSSTEDGGLPGLSASIHAHSIDDGRGTIALEFVNESQRSLAELGIAASGSHIRAAIYGEETIDQLDSSESHVHYVDVDIETTETASIPVAVTATVNGHSLSETFEIDATVSEGNGEPVFGVDRKSTDDRLSVSQPQLSTQFEIV